MSPLAPPLRSDNASFSPAATSPLAPDPLSTTRTAFDIVTLCFSTLIVCVWHAVHVDIPKWEEGFFREVGRRVGWMLIGMFMPDWLLHLSCSQLLMAWTLLDHAHGGYGTRSKFCPSWVVRAWCFAKSMLYR